MSSNLRARRLAGAALVLAALGALPSCNWRRAAFQAGLGSLAGPFTVTSVTRRADWIDAELSGGASGIQMRSFAPVDEACTAVLEPEAQVRYVDRGVGGRFERDGQSCEAAGVGEPFVSRGRRPRGGSLASSPIPRAAARFQVLHEDADVILLRGMFPLASRIGWSGGRDSIAVVPNDARCQAAVRGGNASMEFRPAGQTTLGLVSSGGLCPIVGLIRPPPGR